MALIFNGERLKKARLYRGMTVSDLAENLGMSKQAISQYETGKNQPEKTKLFNISAALGFPYSYFYQADTISIVSGTTYFRSLLSTTKKERIQQYCIIEYLSLIYSFLSKYVDFPESTIPSISEENSTSAELAAESVRALWKLGSGPIEDMTYILESHGIVVSYLSTEHHNIDAYSQLLSVDGEQRFFVVLSSDKNSASRTQFDAAHELGHILLHTWSEDIESLPRDEFKDREKQAHSFAAAFLLPKASFLQDLSGHGKLARSLYYSKEKMEGFDILHAYESFPVRCNYDKSISIHDETTIDSRMENQRTS